MYIINHNQNKLLNFVSMAKILITGGSGFIGKNLAHFLTEEGHSVSLLTRNPFREKFIHRAFEWNQSENFINEKAFEDVEYIVHLAGEGIADKRWDSARKTRILESRTHSTKLLIKYIEKLKLPLKSFIGASAVGYYGNSTEDKICYENSPAGIDFLGEIGKAWEDAYLPLHNLQIPLYILRIGVVLDSKGGALKKMLPVFKRGLGSALGSGKQYMPWIHHYDLSRLMLQCITQQLKPGIYNAVAPQHLTNKDFSKALATALHKPFIMPTIPAFVLKIIYGEMADVILKGNKVSAEKLLGEGFEFKFGDIHNALKNLMR